MGNKGFEVADQLIGNHCRIDVCCVYMNLGRPIALPDAHYMHPRLAAVYDSTCGWSEDRDFYLSLANREHMRILDLACGTGLLTRAYARKGHTVTGVDPASAMLEIARAFDAGKHVEWICSDAQSFRSGQKFDLIVMTGNAFQVFLDDQDVLAVLQTMKTHLVPGGCAVFETRNPDIAWEDRWNTDQVVTANGAQHRETRRVISRHSNFIRFETGYIFPEETLISESTLRFHGVDDLTKLIERAGLHVVSVKCDWRGDDFDKERSEEIVFSITLADR